MSIAVGILFGLAPAIQVSRLKLIDELKSGGKSAHTASIRSHFLRNALVTSEIALSLTLLAGAALLLRTFANLRAIDVGVKAESTLTAAIQLPAKKYPTPEEIRGFCARLVESLASAPGIRTAALTTELPLQGGNNGYIQVDGQSDKVTAGQLVETTAVTPEYFHALGIPLIRGRGLTNADLENTAGVIRKLIALQPDEQKRSPADNLQAVAMINQTMARRFWPNQDAIGKTYRKGDVQIQVIGIVGDTKVFGLRQTPIPQAYYPLTWITGGGRTFRIVVQTGGNPLDAASTVRNVVRSLDGGLAVYQLQTMTDIAAATMANDSQQTFLLGTFAAFALILAAIGTYGVMSYLVTQRTGEIGIRMALGARRSAMLLMVLRQGLTLAMVGVGIGLAGALATSRLLESLLFGVKPSDPATLAGVSVLMIAVTMIACIIPAMRAMRVEPMIALRHE